MCFVGSRCAFVVSASRACVSPLLCLVYCCVSHYQDPFNLRHIHKEKKFGPNTESSRKKKKTKRGRNDKSKFVFNDAHNSTETGLVLDDASDTSESEASEIEEVEPEYTVTIELLLGSDHVLTSTPIILNKLNPLGQYNWVLTFPFLIPPRVQPLLVCVPLC